MKQSMKITNDGFAVLENDTHLSRWVEEQRRLDVQFDTRILSLMEPGNSVVDVGAALGDHTIAYANRVGATGKVYAFEPNPSQLKCLRYNMRGLPNVEVVGFALGSAPGQAEMVLSPNVSASHLDHGSGTVEVITLDSFLCGLPVHFIKVDVEGDELAVLAGSRETIVRHRPKLIIEINAGHLIRVGSSENDIFDFLDGLGYEHSVFAGECSGPLYDLMAQPRP